MIGHKDGDRGNCQADNLEWRSASYVALLRERAKRAAKRESIVHAI
ncbi:HNH endonuclease [Chthonobacter rhizosphaerae]